jgi:type II secretory pathway predicted ATPase ExeA/tetratricopeptide (TPR) repeat protein
MYKTFYDLTAIPFNITSYPKLSSLSPKHEEGMLRLLNGITRKKRLMVLTGEVGTGKTNLLNSLARKLDKRTHLAFLVNSSLTIFDILRYALHEWKVEAVDESKDGVFTGLRNFLVSCEEMGENVLLIIDESQNLSRETLEVLIDFAQKETLLQIILCGQLDLEAGLRKVGSIQEKQNLGLMYRLEPLNYDETKSYMERSLIASGAQYPIFTSDAIKDIYKHSKGIPRVISAMADLALLFGFADQEREIGRSIIGRVAKTLDYRESARSVGAGGKRNQLALPIRSAMNKLELERMPTFSFSFGGRGKGGIRNEGLAGLLAGGKIQVRGSFRRPVVALVASMVVCIGAFMLFFRVEHGSIPWFKSASSPARASLRSLPENPSQPIPEPIMLSLAAQPAAAPLPSPTRQEQGGRPVTPADTEAYPEEKNPLQEQTEVPAPPADTKAHQEEKNSLPEQTEVLVANNILPSAIRDIDLQAKALSTQGRYAEAETLYVRSLDMQGEVLSPEDPTIASTLNNLAGVYYVRGKYAKAEALYQRLLGLDEKRLGPEHPHVATSLNNLAVLYDTQGRHDKAEPLYRRALAIKEKTLGPGHPGLATSLNNLAVLYEAQGRYAEAEPLYRRALAIKEKTLGPDHPDLATSLSNLAVLYRTQGRYDEAEPLYRRALAIEEKTLGPDHPDLATSLSNLAVLYQAQGRYDEAEPLYKRALTMDEKRLGPEHPDVATTLENYAALLRTTQREAEAEELKARVQKTRALHSR